MARPKHDHSPSSRRSRPAFELSGRGLLATSISAITLASAVGATPVHAEEGVIEEILVTVQRREESVEDVPLAVSAFSGNFIQDVNLDDVKDLALYTPGMSGNTKDSFIDWLSIRGIYTLDFGVGGDPSIGFFKNSLYQGRNGVVVSSFYDMDRAEVVRGSQGFLFGRNTIAGAVSVYTTRPNFDGVNGYISGDFAERGHIEGQGAVNFVLSEHWAARIAAYHSEEDGYVKDVFDPSRPDLISQDKTAVRGSLRGLWDQTDVNLMVEYEDRKQSGSIYRAIEEGDTWITLSDLFGVELSGSNQDSDSDLFNGEKDDGEVLTVGLQVDHDFGSVMFTSLTGYKDHDYSYAEDFDGSPLRINNYLQDQSGDYFEQEFRLVSQGEGPLTWYGGVSYYHENIDTLFSQVGDEETLCDYYSIYYGYADCNDYFLTEYGYPFVAIPEGLVESNQVKGTYQGWSAYADVTYAFTESFDASVGLRYTWDEKKFSNNALPVDSMLGPYFGIGFTTDGPLEAKKSWDDLTPRVVLRYFVNDDWMTFGSVTWGYKSGGFGSFALNPSQPYGSTDVTQDDARPDDFKPETSVSYEIGTKGSFANRRGLLTANVYYYDYEDLQVIVPGIGGGIRVDNAGKVKGWGVEGTLQLVLGENWDVYLSGAWADSEATNVEDALCGGSDECEGNRLGNQPELSYSATLQGTFPTGPGELFGRLELYGQTKTYGGQTLNPVFVNDAWTELTLRAGYRANSGWDITAYVENLTDEEYFDATSEDSGILPGHYIGMSRPRTIGVRIGWEFD
ncbi:MAG: TonB-dependent receptor [Pseudomonadales bacterium]